MEAVKPNIAEMELPTGVMTEKHGVVKVLQFRELSGHEEDILASSLSPTEKMSKVMAQCTIKAGPIEDPREIRDIIDRLLIADRWLFLIRLRCLSLGNFYHFEQTCPECGNSGKESIDLMQIGVENPPSANAIFKEIKLPSGRSARIKAADGRVDALIAKMANDQNAATVALFSRVSELDGQPPAISDIKNLSMADRSFIRKSIDELEGDLNDEVLIKCSKCQHERKEPLNLDGVSFFSL